MVHETAENRYSFENPPIIGAGVEFDDEHSLSYSYQYVGKHSLTSFLDFGISSMASLDLYVLTAWAIQEIMSPGNQTTETIPDPNPES